MVGLVLPSEEKVAQTVDAYWESYPPFWSKVRAHIRQAAAEEFDMSVEQFHILRHIRNGVHSVSELAEVKQISRAAISQGVDMLVNRGLITRTQDTGDRRHVRLDLTTEGDELLDAILSDTRRWMAQMFACLSNDELQAIICSMDALKRVMAA